MIETQPLFLQNPEWYKYDFKSGKYVLTDEATPEARKSYEKFYNVLIDVTTNPIPTEERNESDFNDAGQVKNEQAVNDEELEKAKQVFGL